MTGARFAKTDHATAYEQLCSMLCARLKPLIKEGLVSIRSQADGLAVEGTAPTGPESPFVQMLNEVPQWSQILLDKEVARVVQRMPYFQKLLTALYCLKVKILSSISMRKDQRNIPVNIPTLQKFVHWVYICASREINDNQHVLQHFYSVDVNPLIEEAIREAISQALAWVDILDFLLPGDAGQINFDPEEEPGETGGDEEETTGGEGGDDGDNTTGGGVGSDGGGGVGSDGGGGVGGDDDGGGDDDDGDGFGDMANTDKTGDGWMGDGGDNGTGGGGDEDEGDTVGGGGDDDTGGGGGDGDMGGDGNKGDGDTGGGDVNGGDGNGGWGGERKVSFFSPPGERSGGQD